MGNNILFVVFRQSTMVFQQSTAGNNILLSVKRKSTVVFWLKSGKDFLFSTNLVKIYNPLPTRPEKTCMKQ